MFAAAGFASLLASLIVATGTPVIPAWISSRTSGGLDTDVTLTQALPALSILTSVLTVAGLLALARAVFIDRN